VPRFVGDELSGDVRHTAKNFGASWKIWNSIDDDRYHTQLLRWMPSLSPGDVAGKTLLDGGCGKGRHLRVMAGLDAREVVGVDVSDAVDVAYTNTRELGNVHVVQADLHRLPLRDEFDLAYSIGVLHHTPRPGRSFAAIARHVRPGGSVACWVYGRENNGWIIWLVNPIRLGLTRYLPPGLLRLVAWLPAVILQLLIVTVYGPAESFGLRLFYRDYLLNLRRLGFAEIRHIVYDHLVAPTAHYLRRDEVESWLDDAALVDGRVTWIHRNSWAADGVRAAAA
jgi:SAM-dependent methyltransferase